MKRAMKKLMHFNCCGVGFQKATICGRSDIMLVEKFEMKEHTVTENVLVDQHLFCDVCGKEIENGKDYYKLITGHNDWGNDSCDSIETSDICSYECLNIRLRSYVDRSFGGKPNTEYFEVAHKTYFKRVKE